MQFLQKSLMVVIMVQVLVLAEVSFFKFGNESFNLSWLSSSLNSESTNNKSLDDILITSLRKQVDKKMMSYEDTHLIYGCLALLDKERLDKREVQIKKVHRSIRSKIEDNAKRFLGYRYVWGATGPNKFDCSGFTQKVFRNVGINLPRVSREQAKVGKYVSFNALKKGDIVFFDTKHRKTGRVTHVGIYLEDGKFIHASSGGKRVMITSFKQRAFYKNRFLWGRRII